MCDFFTWPWRFTEAIGPTFPFEPFVSPLPILWLCSVHSSPIIITSCSCKDAFADGRFHHRFPNRGIPLAAGMSLLLSSRLISNFVVLGVLMVTLGCFRRVSSWQTRLISTAIVGSASAGALLAASPTWGDPARPIVNEKFSDFAPAIAELRQEAGQDRRILVRANMLLTETESARFWPLYDEYRTERQKIGDRRVRLITDFLAAENAMSEDKARALANEDFAIGKDTAELKAKWYAKMTKVLSERTIARFFHIDEKLAADIALAANIPLIH